MRKKMLAALLAVSMVASMTACGSSKSESTDGAKEASDLKIGLITDVGGVNDGSFNQSSWEGLERAGEELGVTVNYLESATDADYKPNIETFIDEDYDLIISVGYMLADATREAAEANPDTKFAIIDDATIDLPNVTSLMFKAEQASYLVGYVAGLTTKSNNSWYDQRDHEPVRIRLLCRCYRCKSGCYCSADECKLFRRFRYW